MKTYTYNRPRLRKNYVGTPTTVKQGRTVTAVVSVFSNVDFQGDRVMPGAFTHSLRKWEMSGKKIPVIWAHEWADPFAIVGYVSSARETDEGLEVDMVLDETPFADQVLELIKSRRVDNYSFSYDVVRERKARDGATELIELDLIECGPCLRGANSATYTVGVKSDTTATSSAKVFSRAGRHESVHTVGAVGHVHHAAEKARTTDMILDDFWSKARTRDASSDEDIRRTLDDLEYGDMDARVRKAEADVFIAETQGAYRRAKADAKRRQDRIAATIAEPTDAALVLRRDMTAYGDEPTEDAIGETERIPVWAVAAADEPETFRLERGVQNQIGRE